MKTNFLMVWFLVTLLSLLQIGVLYADDPVTTTTTTTSTPLQNLPVPQQANLPNLSPWTPTRSPSDPEPSKVIVTEILPGMKDKCKCIAASNDCTDVTKRKYECEVSWGFDAVQEMLGGLIKWTTFIVALLGVLMLVWSGIEMSMSGLGGKKDEAKKRIEKIVIGLVLLFAIGLILNSVAPWIYK